MGPRSTSRSASREVQGRPGQAISATRGSRNGALDGMRGLAVIAVMAYHVVPDPFTGGWLGVDMFFVLSGFLICSMLLRERERTHTIDYVRFLGRRARRLLPGLALMLVAVLGAAMIFETGGRRRSVAIDVVASALQVSNWRLILADESYFAQVGAPSPIRHTWSLGVQEQFYVVFPLVLLLLFARVRNYRTMTYVFGGVAVLSLASMIWLYDPGLDPSRVYFGTETRLFELLIGVIGAIVLHRRARRALRRPRPGRPRGWRRQTEEAFGWFGLVALLLLGYWMFTVDEFSPWLFLGGIVIIDLLTMLVIVAVTSPFPNILTRLLAVRPLMKAGDMSYSLYIWHWPVIVYLVPIMEGSSELARQITAVVVTIAISWVSYTFVENPIHRHGLQALWRRRPRVGPALATAAGPVVLAGAVALAATPALASAESVGVNLPADPYYGTAAADLPADVPRQEVVLVGASTAAGLGARGKTERTPDVDVEVVASLGCDPLERVTSREGGVTPESANCSSYRDRWVEAVDTADDPVAVFFLHTALFYDVVVDGQVASPPSPEYDAAITDYLDQLDQTARDNGASRVAVINMACHQRPDFGKSSAVSRSNDLEMVQHFNKVVDEWAKDADADVYDNYKLLCPGDRYYGEVNGLPLYDDGLHFTKQSAPLMWRWVASQVRSHRD
ncbi:acyltransferase family protein [Janibacter indicus]